MMKTIIAIAGAIQLANWLMSLIEAIKTPCAQAVQSKAQRALTANHHSGGR